MPTETGRDILARGFALVMEGIEALSRESVPAARVDHAEVMTSSQAAAEIGVTTTAVSQWCGRGFIDGATHRARGCAWSFTRGAWADFLRNRRRLRRRLSAVQSAA